MTRTAVRRSRRRSTSSVQTRTATLAQFSAQLGEHAGRAVPFMSCVIDLADARAQIKVLKARRLEIFDQLKRRYHSGTVMTSDGGVVLTMTEPTAIVDVRTVESATVKAARPDMWAAARVPTPYVVARAPKDWSVTAPRLPPIPRAVDDLDRCVGAYRHPAFARLTELAEIESAAIATLAGIADEFGWDGMPLSFSDDWSIGLRTLRFSADRLAEIAPEVFESLAIDTTRGGTSRLYLGTPGREDVELDAE